MRISHLRRNVELKARDPDPARSRAVCAEPWENVRIHLDEVEGLGSFIELEAVAGPESDLAPEQQRVQALRDAFGIAESCLVAPSYSDLARPPS